MSDPWFDPRLAWVPGTALGCAVGLWGGVAGLLASWGRARGAVFVSLAIIAVAAAVCLGLGIVAYVQNQPRDIWYGLGFAGLLVLVLSAFSIPVLLGRYHGAEQRRRELDELARVRAQVKELSGGRVNRVEW
jgi:hypothetical protein